ncbi:adenosylmethionine--8-amino-7-oxononanoate transaminase [Candidatus Riesia pediculischaeffi]|uniref:Adenosylmethionine-8-amino-7-oxononanoate aminotransferase n=2 Tax=Candidatus Riesia pediculischaeffi TaxID=428411 RepID=A0A1V0HJW6_9ENTR|nr:adenosylmethionine--8-amino-7-oxononanoate transaminase [Candidatus Riesia pediculischaeffi]ARC53126.1 adenosylmethionine-8-amino-7-oxononanoate aminotransferase [Candidatus Riesia pediculischaeffi]
MKKSEINFDSKHVWHPYSPINRAISSIPAVSASGTKIKLSNGNYLIDGMSSWWSAIHGYNHPILNKSIKKQLQKMSHIMFGGITHKPAISLCKKLINITSNKLECVFLADSGSVSIEIALKMAVQYWQSRGKKNKKKFVALQYGYHGDTLGAMSVCDPKNSMHSLYKGYLPKNFFTRAPYCNFHEDRNQEHILFLEKLFVDHSNHISAMIIEPIVQGAGGMRFYHPNYLKNVRKLCDQYDVLLIIDEIATGFGRTGKFFAYEYGDIFPDILCLGKALTGGYLTLAAVMTTKDIANTISEGEAKCLMHGPTFMANPLACEVANSSIDLLISGSWRKKIKKIEKQLIEELDSIRFNDLVKNVRVLGAIGVVEMKNQIDLNILQKKFVDLGVWIRPFRKIIYIIPPYIIEEKDLTKLTDAVKEVIFTISNSEFASDIII